MTKKTLPRTKVSVVTRTMGTELVLLDVDGGKYYSLNSTGRFIWERLPDVQGMQELTTVVAAEFGLTTAQAQADCEAFIQMLITAKLTEN